MIVRRHPIRAAAIGALAAGVLVAAAAAGQTPPPKADDCKELTGAERTRCEQRVKEDEAPPGKESAAPPAPVDRSEEPPPDTKSDSDDHSDTADPPQG
ncbi:MAG TPA: hypothetical protein VJQ52_14395 [Steroidobacteraceae bacterium]|nr:hypothetical protein [Steroidobacteraceae bacterium]